MAHLDFSRAVRGVDSLLRYYMRIEEFTERPDCIFRIAHEQAPESVLLSDGTRIEKGDPVLELHLWNEHLPPMTNGRPDAAWANRVKRRFQDSLTAVAAHLQSNPLYDPVQALYGLPPFASRIGAVQMVRTAKRFGFDVIEPEVPAIDSVYRLFDSIFLWSLAYAFNSANVRGRKLLKHRYRLWISRPKLLSWYSDRAANGELLRPH